MSQDTKAELAEVEGGDAADPNVSDGLDTTKDGRPRGSLRNVVWVLKEDARWSQRLRWSTFEDAAFLDGSPLTDDGLTAVGLWLDEVYALCAGPETLMRVVRTTVIPDTRLGPAAPRAIGYDRTHEEYASTARNCG